MRAIDARGLTRDFDGVRAVEDMSLHVERGETLGLLGPNGAGKTTTVAMLTTLLRPTSGTASVAGHDILAEPHAVRRAIGVVFQGPSLELTLTARQNLRYHARLYKMDRALAERRMAELLQVVELDKRADEQVHKFSGGMRRRLEVARGVLHQPHVLFLDEPTIGLDPQARLHVWDLLTRLQEEEHMALLLTTHHMEEAERLADRVAIMDHGRLLQVDTPARLRAALGEEVVRLRVARGKQALSKALEARRGNGLIQGVQWKGDEAHVRVASAERVLPEILGLVERSGARLINLEVHRPTLEDVFIARTGKALRDEP